MVAFGIVGLLAASSTGHGPVSYDVGCRPDLAASLARFTRWRHAAAALSQSRLGRSQRSAVGRSTPRRAV